MVCVVYAAYAIFDMIIYPPNPVAILPLFWPNSETVLQAIFIFSILSSFASLSPSPAESSNCDTTRLEFYDKRLSRVMHYSMGVEATSEGYWRLKGRIVREGELGRWQHWVVGVLEGFMEVEVCSSN